MDKARHISNPAVTKSLLIGSSTNNQFVYQLRAL
jgi:hypothetical protein